MSVCYIIPQSEGSSFVFIWFCALSFLYFKMLSFVVVSLLFLLFLLWISRLYGWFGTFFVLRKALTCTFHLQILCICVLFSLVNAFLCKLSFVYG